MSKNTTDSERLDNLESLLEKKIVDWESDEMYGESDFNIAASQTAKWVLRLIRDEEPFNSISERS